MNKKDFAARIRDLRIRRNLTQGNLAELSDLSVDTIRRLEHGGFNPSLDTMNKIGKGLGLVIEQVLKEGCDESDDLAALIRSLPDTERRVASSVLGTLFVHAAGLN